MDISTTTVAELTEEDVRKAIADYASKAHAGDYSFDDATVEYLNRESVLNFEVRARVTT